MRMRLVGPSRAVRIVGLIVVLVCLRAVPGMGRERLPYRAQIAFDDTPIFSGPNDGFYATDYLAAGSTVDVLRRDPGGWLAIRPPEGSFSWVPADRLEFTDRADEAEVIADRTQVWIGSRVETVRDHHWQVSLEPGHFVRVLGRRTLGDGRSSRAGEWLQIAPPHGELRWVHESKLRESAERHSAAIARSRAAALRSRIERETELETDRDADRAADQSAVAAARSTSREPAELNPERSASAADPLVTRAPPQAAPADFAEFPSADYANPVGSDFPIEPAQFARSPDRSRPDSVLRDRAPMDGSVARDDAATGGEWREARRRRGASVAAPSAAGVSNASDAGPLPFSSRQAELELEDISLQFSSMVARDASFWNFGPLMARVEELIERAPTPLDRGRARLLYEKIAAFEENRRQFDQATRTPVVPPTAQTGSTATGIAAASGAAATNSSSDKEPRFDGSGWLLPVHSTKQLAPPFALMDDEGRVLQYVTPAAGLNLHRYTRKRIGIYGQRGTFPSLNAPLLTAHRIVELERHGR